MHRLCPPHRPGMDRDALLAGLPDGGHQAGARRGRRDGASRRRRSRGTPPRTRDQPARVLPEPPPLDQGPRGPERGLPRHRRMRGGRPGDDSAERREGRRRHLEQLRRRAARRARAGQGLRGDARGRRLRDGHGAGVAGYEQHPREGLSREGLTGGRMDFETVLRGRRSIRAYTSEPVSDELIGAILDEARWTPSWRNTQAWSIWVVTGEALTRFKERFAQAVANEEPLRPDFLLTSDWPAACSARTASLMKARAATLAAAGESTDPATAIARMADLFGAPCLLVFGVED